jgi:hypothetical protein
MVVCSCGVSPCPMAGMWRCSACKQIKRRACARKECNSAPSEGPAGGSTTTSRARAQPSAPTGPRGSVSEEEEEEESAEEDEGSVGEEEHTEEEEEEEEESTSAADEEAKAPASWVWGDSDQESPDEDAHQDLAEQDAEDDQYEVEKVLRHYKVGRTMMCVVKWKGCGSDQNTQEPIENIDSTPEFHYYVNKIQKGKALREHCQCANCKVE